MRSPGRFSLLFSYLRRPARSFGLGQRPIQHAGTMARWLLMCHDRLDGDNLGVTHEFLALMLGVRRSGVTEQLHVLEGIRAIRSTRRNIHVRDREKLITIAGGSSSDDVTLIPTGKTLAAVFRCSHRASGPLSLQEFPVAENRDPFRAMQARRSKAFLGVRGDQGNRDVLLTSVCEESRRLRTSVIFPSLILRSWRLTVMSPRFSGRKFPCWNQAVDGAFVRQRTFPRGLALEHSSKEKSEQTCLTLSQSCLSWKTSHSCVCRPSQILRTTVSSCSRHRAQMKRLRLSRVARTSR